VGIAPLEADIEAMRRTVRGLEAAIEARDSSRARELLCPHLSEKAQNRVLETVEARVRSLPPGSRYRLRSDFTSAGVVPTGPHLVQLQVTGTITHEGADQNAPVYLELDSNETDGRRQWLLHRVSFSGVRVGPSPSSVGWMVGGVVAFVVVGIVIVVAIRRRRGKRVYF
jgi:hypothetical protein